MSRRFLAIFLLFIFPVFSFPQIISYSDPIKGDPRTDFQIIGKVGGNIIIFKNVKDDYNITVYDNEMKLKETVPLDFLPDKTFNVNYIAYQNFFYLIYQYQKKRIVYCSAVKVDEDAKVIGQPINIDTTDIGNHVNKIYAVVNSEDKQKIMIAKTLQQNDALSITTMLFDNTLQLIKKAHQDFSYNDDRTIFNNLFVDNDGDLFFNIATKNYGKDYYYKLDIVTKPALADSFSINNIDLKEKYITDIYVKVDNINKHAILNAFFYTEKRGNVQGIYANVWDKQTNSPQSNVFISFGDSVRQALKREGRMKEALNNFQIKNVTVKKDGGYILMAEDYTAQQSGGTINNNPYYFNPFFNPYGFNTPSVTTYYCQNIFIVSIDKNGMPEWNNVIAKDQYHDNDDNPLSFFTFNTGGEIHLFFNETIKRTEYLSDISVKANGDINKNAEIMPTKGYGFLPKFGKQVGAKQFILPCVRNNAICFAKIDY
ncbi:MAG TPA: hypothetical protein VK559_05505 [Ferruginibacter sp.]|nr:hypothetical protein [Ferruginibacter sp.]